jgi:PIN domain nuclease of toxin-antitoxin system
VRLLLDTHTLLWAVDDPAQLGSRAVAELQDLTNELLLSAGSLWELAIKVGAKKLDLSLPYRQWISQAISDLGLTILPISVEHADVQTELPFHHQRPFRPYVGCSVAVRTDSHR